MRKLTTFLFLLLCAYFLLPRSDWTRYYTKKLYKPAATVTLQALLLKENPGRALDFGCGCGNDTALLLNQGWEVWAIDGAKEAMKVLLSRQDLPMERRLHAATEKFEAIHWDSLPQMDLFLAINSLPFCHESKFDEMWSNIAEKIAPQGLFAGHFFGNNYKGFTDQEKKGMTFLNREAILILFKDFEIVLLDEHEKENRNDMGRRIHAHIFTVIARKKAISKLFPVDS